MGRLALIKVGAWHVGMVNRWSKIWVKFLLLAVGLVGVGGGCQSVEQEANREASSLSEVLTPAAAAIVEAIDVNAEAGAPTMVMERIVPGTPIQRYGDEIVVAGKLFRTGTPVVLWMDEDGYDGYRVERLFSELDRAGWDETMDDGVRLDSPNRYGMRAAVLTRAEQERVRGGGWDLPTLQRVVDQFVLHYDVSGTSAQCFKRLHDDRGLSIHFMLDVDGTIYQTLDLKERAWHATVANSRSIGIEIANIGAYENPDAEPLREWYETDDAGVTRLTIPAHARPERVRTADFEGRPARAEIVTGKVNGAELFQYDFTEEQYAALAKLTASLCAVFPNIACDFPRDAGGNVRETTLSTAEFKAFQGIIGHSHIQTNKIDPGPAFDWERVIGEARELLKPDGEAELLSTES